MLALPVRGLILDEDPSRESKVLNSHFWLDDSEGSDAFSAQIDIPIVLTGEFRKRLTSARFFGYNTCSQELKLKQDSYRLIFALHDPDTERTGTIRQDLPVPDLRNRDAPLIANAVFGQMARGRPSGRSFSISERDGTLQIGEDRFHPMGVNRFSRGRPIFLFLQVFIPGKKPRLNARFNVAQANGATAPIPAEKVREAWNGKANVANLVFKLDFSGFPVGEKILTAICSDRGVPAAESEISLILF